MELVLVLEELPQALSVVVPAFLPSVRSFKRQVTVEVAIQSVQELHSTVSGVLGNYGSCSSCGGASAASSYSSHYQSIIVKTFTSWQSIMSVGHSLYDNVWEPQFAPLFRQFNPFLTAVQQNSGFFGINLGNILGGLHLNLNLFSSCGLNIGGLLGGVLSTVGGLLGGLKDHEEA
ncbi:expressed protein [Phakopsora pachyrhizi]|uniref:Expressed protein n=1 Tax=Phakopsora pachyrhizi TaxID=170000 RepID=A0AAV0ALV5_PHAPC|nr:expressed protein [Phakopsora pachyrhizi]